MKTPEQFHSQLEPLMDALRFDPIGIDWETIDQILACIQKEAFEEGLAQGRRPTMVKCSKCGKQIQYNRGWIDALREHHVCFECMGKFIPDLDCTATDGCKVSTETRK